MTIKEIVDKIAKEGSLNTSEYSVADRIIDVNNSYLKHIEIARQIGSLEPIRAVGETFTETFTVATGNNIFTRTIEDVAIQRVDFQPTGATLYKRLDEDATRSIDGWYDCRCMRYFADEKYIYVQDAIQTGTLRITYVGGDITLFTSADYSSSTPPSPAMLPLTFQPLLWLEPAMNKAMFYKKERFEGLKYQYDTLYALFYKHYRRNTSKVMKAQTKTMYNSGTGIDSNNCC